MAEHNTLNVIPGVPDTGITVLTKWQVTVMNDPRTVRQTMSELGIGVQDVARACAVDPSHASRQLRGLRPLQSCVRTALVDILDARATAALPHVARLLRAHGEADAAQACERLWGLLG
jgi:hypothetical protein